MDFWSWEKLQARGSLSTEWCCPGGGVARGKWNSSFHSPMHLISHLSTLVVCRDFWAGLWTPKRYFSPWVMVTLVFFVGKRVENYFITSLMSLHSYSGTEELTFRLHKVKGIDSVSVKKISNCHELVKTFWKILLFWTIMSKRRYIVANTE